MRTVHTQILGLLVHHVAKGQSVSTNMLGYGVGRIVVAHQHHFIDEVAQPIAISQPHSGVLGDIDIVGYK